jgi:probable addiction module antidote protein
MSKSARRYEDDLRDSLKDPKEAAAYLNAHLQDHEEDSEALFLLALRDVSRAHGISEIATKTDLGRESLYKTLSHDGNPKFQTLKSILKSIGLKLAIEEEKEELKDAS